MREFRLDVRRHPKEDPLGDPSEYDPDDRGGLQRFNVHFAPRWAGMHVRSSSGTVSEYNVPDGIEEAINAAIIGSNIEATRYPELLRPASTPWACRVGTSTASTSTAISKTPSGTCASTRTPAVRFTRETVHSHKCTTCSPATGAATESS